MLEFSALLTKYLLRESKHGTLWLHDGSLPSSLLPLKMAAYVYTLLLVTTLLNQTTAQDYRNEGIMGHIANGMKFAQNLLATESVAHKVAEFVVRAFQTNTHSKRPPTHNNLYDNASHEDNVSEENRPNEEINEAVNPMTPIKHLVRLFGLQPNQISAVAVNALVFVAQMISTFLTGPRRSYKPRTEDPMEWILNKKSRNLQELLSTAKNESLPQILEDIINEQGSEEKTSCIRLLVCKITPFIVRMQMTVFGKEKRVFDKDIKGAAIMYQNLPSTDEINERSHFCEKRYRHCNLNE